MMHVNWWCSWLGAVALGLSVVTAMPARAEEPPGDKAASADDPDEARRLYAESGQLFREGKYDDALRLAERALSLRYQALGQGHPIVAQSLNSLATLYQAKGDYARAEPLLQRSLRIREKALGPDHPDVAQSLNNLAELYVAKGDYARAEPVHQRARSMILPRYRGHTHYAEILSDFNKINSNSIGLT